MEAALINHILVPLDGSTLAECVLPHVIAIAPMTNARVTLVHVMEPLQNERGSPAVDPVEWHLQKQNSEKYLEQVAGQLKACWRPGRRARSFWRATLPTAWSILPAATTWT